MKSYRVSQLSNETRWSQIVKNNKDIPIEPLDEKPKEVVVIQPVINNTDEFYMIKDQNSAEVAEKMIRQTDIERDAIDLLDKLRSFVNKHSYSLIENLTLQFLIDELYHDYKVIF